MLSGFELYPRWVPLTGWLLRRHQTLAGLGFSSHIRTVISSRFLIEQSCPRPISKVDSHISDHEF